MDYESISKICCKINECHTYRIYTNTFNSEENTKENMNATEQQQQKKLNA